MDISIITPSYNMLPYLEKCAASIADQQGCRFEHIVMDAVSTDGTVEWLAGQDHILGVSEKDNGMYDALNKGFKKASGDILAYLNCDEQYLPGTLEFVRDYFQNHPYVDIVFGHLLLIRPDGSLVAYRKGYQPRWPYILTSHLYVLTCTMFFRRKIVDDGCFFDTHYRIVGDMEFVVRLLRRGYKARHLKRYFSAFTVTGNNLSVDENAEQEIKTLKSTAPAFIQLNKFPLNLLRLTGKFFSGAYFQKMPLEYSVYTDKKGIRNSDRTLFRVEKASSKWRFQ